MKIIQIQFKKILGLKFNDEILNRRNKKPQINCGFDYFFKSSLSFLAPSSTFWAPLAVASFTSLLTS